MKEKLFVYWGALLMMALCISGDEFREHNDKSYLEYSMRFNEWPNNISDPSIPAPFTDGEIVAETSTKTLEQNIEDYYNSVDIEFENFSDGNDILNISLQNKVDNKKENESKNTDEARYKRNAKSKELSDDDIEQEIYEELVESYDDNDGFNENSSNDEDSTIEDSQREKFYRDTFMDRIIEDMKAKRPKSLLVKKEKRDVNILYKKDRELTGDTVLHLHSEISDVIKSETDLKSTLLPANKNFPKENTKSESYVDNFMIHPSEFIQDTTPFQPTTNKLRQDEMDNGNNNKNDRIDDIRNGRDLDNNESIEDNAVHGNDSNVVLAVLDSIQLLKCPLRVADVKSIIWLKDGEKVFTSNGIGSGFEMTPKGDVIIKRVGREHQGKWRCQVQKPSEKENSPILVNVERELIVMESPSPPYLEVFGRRLDPGNVFLPTREGTELVMGCHAERGTPSPSLHWETSKPLQMTHHHKQGPQITSSIAALVVRRSHHNTTISCYCKHPTLDVPMVASTLLHVQYAPGFGISRTPGFGFPLEEGSAVSLKCEVDSNPPATPTWRKDEKEPPVEQTDDGYLNFTSVRREHSGWYKCIATHPLGNFSSIGYFLNVRYEVESATEQQVYHQTVSKSEEHLGGGVVQLQCPPGSVGCWSRNNPTPSSSAPVGLIKQDKQGGSYVCSGLSPSEASRLHAMLGEHNALSGGTPAVYPTNASLTVKEDSSLILEGEFCVEAGEPPARVLWLAQGRALGLPDNYNRITTHNFKPTNSTSSIQCNVAKLSISTCKASDSGEYSLVVRGKRGIGEAIFHVQVLEKERHTLVEQLYNEVAPHNASPLLIILLLKFILFMVL